MTSPTIQRFFPRHTLALLGILLLLVVRSAQGGNSRDEHASIGGRHDPVSPSSGFESHTVTPAKPSMVQPPAESQPAAYQPKSLLLWSRLALLVMVLMIAL